MLIYKITRILDDGSQGKIYIGQTIHNLNKRKSDYKKDVHKLKNQKIKPRPILSAMLKYGFDNFEWSILEDNIENSDILDEREVYWISLLNAIDKKIGYNISLGGNSVTRGIKITGDNLEKLKTNALIGSKIAAELSRGKPQVGAKLEASRENIKKAQKQSAINRSGKHLGEEHKNKISKGNKNNPKRIAASKLPKLKSRVKLTGEQIENIRNDNRVYKYISIEYGVSITTILRIKKRQRYFT